MLTCAQQLVGSVRHQGRTWKTKKLASE